MKKRNQMLLHIGIFCLFWAIVVAPYWVDAINRVTPTVFGIPFLICYYVFFTILGCVNLFFMNKNVADSYDEKNVVNMDEHKEEAIVDVAG